MFDTFAPIFCDSLVLGKKKNGYRGVRKWLYLFRSKPNVFSNAVILSYSTETNTSSYRAQQNCRLTLYTVI